MITGNELKLLRISAGLTQTEVANKLGNGGYTYQVVGAIEKGKRKFGFPLAYQWAYACGYDIEVSFVKMGGNNVKESEVSEITLPDGFDGEID